MNQLTETKKSWKTVTELRLKSLGKTKTETEKKGKTPKTLVNVTIIPLCAWYVLLFTITEPYHEKH